MLLIPFLNFFDLIWYVLLADSLLARSLGFLEVSNRDLDFRTWPLKYSGLSCRCQTIAKTCLRKSS